MKIWNQDIFEKRLLLKDILPNEKQGEKILALFCKLLFFAVLCFALYNIEIAFTEEINRPTRITITPQTENGDVTIRGARVDGQWIDISSIVITNASWKENKSEATYTAISSEPLIIDLPRGEDRSLTFNIGPTAGSAEIQAGSRTLHFNFYNNTQGALGLAYSLPDAKMWNIPFGVCIVIAVLTAYIAAQKTPLSIYMFLSLKIIKLGKLCFKGGKKLLLPITTALFALGIYTSTNPVWGYSGVDSAAFILMGRSILNGKIPYRDIADNKGLVLYGINALGQSFFRGQVYDIFGIWLIQILLLFLSLVLIEKTAKRLGYRHPFFWALFYLLTISSLVESGNMSEEYSNSFTIIGFYLCAEYFSDIDKKHLWKYGLIFGVSFSFCFFMRPNNALPLAGIIIVLVVFLMAKKQWKEIGVHASFFLLGTVAICMPMGIYLYCNNALEDWLLFTIQMNLQYSDVAKTGFLELINTGYGKSALLFLIFSLSGSAWYMLRQKRNIEQNAFCCTVIVSSALSFWSAFLSGYTFMHYLLIASIPFVMGVMLALSKTKDAKDDTKRKSNYFGAVIVGAAVIWLGMLSWNTISTAYSNIKSIPVVLSEYSFQTGGTRQTILLQLAEKIPEEDRDSVMFIEDGATESTDRYVQMRLFPRERLFICCDLFSNISPQLDAEFQNYLEDPPTYLLSTIPLEDVEGRQSALAGKYDLLETDVYGTVLYRRKEEKR